MQHRNLSRQPWTHSLSVESSATVTLLLPLAAPEDAEAAECGDLEAAFPAAAEEAEEDDDER